MLQVEAVKTGIYSPEDDFNIFLRDNLEKKISENDIVAVTSKIVSLSEQRLVKKSNKDKETLVREESDYYLGRIAYDCHLTIKCGQLIPSAGIDESNSGDSSFILYPINPFESAKKICHFLKDVFKLNHLGVILTDSRTQPLRQGVIGTALSYYGFQGIKSQIGEKDLFGRTLKMTQVNVADALATAATLMMGEGSESCPIALIRAPIQFTELTDNNEIMIEMEKDLYWPLIRNRI